MISRWPFFAARTYSASSSPRTVPLIIVLVAPRLNSIRFGSALPPRCAIAAEQANKVISKTGIRLPHTRIFTIDLSFQQAWFRVQSFIACAEEAQGQTVW